MARDIDRSDLFADIVHPIDYSGGGVLVRLVGRDFFPKGGFQSELLLEALIVQGSTELLRRQSTRGNNTLVRNSPRRQQRATRSGEHSPALRLFFEEKNKRLPFLTKKNT